MRLGLIVMWVALAACQRGDEPFARARRINSLDQAIGGPSAAARVGDYVIENDRIRAVIEQGQTSYLPTDVGGSLIDLDLQRPERAFGSGRGLDQLGQLAPIANLSVARAESGPNVRITRSPDGAEITVAAEAGPVFRILLALGLLLEQRFATVPASVTMYTEYELRPGEAMLRVRTRVGHNVPLCPVGPEDGCPTTCDDAIYDDDCDCPAAAAACLADVTRLDATPLPDRPTASLLDILMGDLPRPAGSGTCTTDTDCDAAAGQRCIAVTQALGGDLRVCRAPSDRDAGVFLGDLLVFGGHLTPFVRGIGYDVESDIRRLFDLNEDTLSAPLDVDAIFATGDRVSVGYMSPGGRILVPIFSGPFSLGATHAATCATDDPGCLERSVVQFERWISVGNGDVASAQAPFLEAAATPTGIVRGRVLGQRGGEPRSGAAVYALHDPRSLPCDAACMVACGPIEGGPADWDLDELRGLNRCRTRRPGFTDGTAAVESFARTDPGTDPIADGDFTMALPPGDYVVVAVDGSGPASPLAPVTVDAGAAVALALAIPPAAALEYAVFDDRGGLVPAKVTVGQLGGAACATDATCGAGELCLAGACNTPWQPLLPLELGGRRPIDGVILTEVSAGGRGRIELPPGEYDVVFSRGPFYTIDRRRVALSAGTTTRIEGVVSRVVDHAGWSSVGFHVHAGNSIDSGVSMDARVDSFLAEDMDFLASSDHDWITDYAPLIRERGLGDRLGTVAGAEITTQEYGHYLAFPLQPQAFSGGEPVPSNGAVQWRGQAPQAIIDAARARGVDGQPVVIDIPHPYDYFDTYRVDPVTLEPSSSLLVILNPQLDPSLLTGDFEAMELANTKNDNRLRRASLGETRAYGEELEALIARARSGAIDRSTFDRLWMQLSSEGIRARLHRTVAEQEAALAGDGAEVACLCSNDGMCGPGLVCERATLTCVAPPGSAEPAPAPDGLCRWSRGIVDDWFNMLDRGMFRTGVGGADAHGSEDGFMRTMLATGATTPPFLGADTVVDAVMNGRAIVTNGPMIHVTANGTGIGGVVTAAAGATVELAIRVEKAPWYDVDRIEIYRNRHLIAWANGCDGGRGNDDEDPDPLPCIAMGDAVVAWDQRVRDTPTGDAWYVVVVYGLDGRSLAPVYQTQVLAEINTPDITQRLFTIIPGLREFLTPRQPSIHPVLPFAFTNPIRVDVGGDGWTPPATPPSWCRPGDAGC